MDYQAEILHAIQLNNQLQVQVLQELKQANRRDHSLNALEACNQLGIVTISEESAQKYIKNAFDAGNYKLTTRKHGSR
jgi:hypothetical protein